MKAPKILIAGLLALSTTVASQAQTVVHLTGSTAFRSAVHTAITQMLQSGFTYAYTGTSFTGANNAIFTGTTIPTTNNPSGISVVIKTSWTGSLAGIETVSQAHTSTQGGFLTNTTPQSVTPGTGSSPTNFDPAVIPEVCMNDGYQYDSQYPTPALLGTPVGVVVFKFLRSPSCPSGVTNLTPLAAQQFWANGQINASLLDGSSTDTNIIYAIGRDPDSGTRKTAFLETGVQQFNSFLSPAQVLQYEPLAGGNQVNRNNEAPATAQIAWPAETVDDISFAQGDAGYSSGGDLAVAVGENSPKFPYITYLGLSDARSAEGLGAVDIGYNGVYFSDSAVENGTYTYWTYEFLSYNQSTSPLAPSANVKAVADLLATTIEAQTLNSPSSGVGESLSAMNVQRTQEGGIITVK